MARTSLKPRFSTFLWRTEALPGDKNSGRTPSAIAFVPRPRSAHLSQDGALSWKWRSTAVLHGFGSKKSPPRRTNISEGVRRIDARLFERFAALADESDELIRRFAAQWGPLHYPGVREELSQPTEKVGEWRRFASLAQALIRCANGLRAGTLGRYGQPGDWAPICDWLQQRPELAPSREYGFFLLASALNAWYDRSAGNGLVETHGTKILMRPHVGLLFGIIGLQLACAITETQNQLACYHCGRYYTPKNQPRTGSRNFCPNCRRRGKPQLYAMRDLRARRKRVSTTTRT